MKNEELIEITYEELVWLYDLHLQNGDTEICEMLKELFDCQMKKNDT